MAATIAKSVGKIGIGVGAVYVTVDQGVWGSNYQGAKALDKVKHSVFPAANDIGQKTVGTVTNDNTVVQYYNCGVKKTFSFIKNIPSNVQFYSQQLYNKAFDDTTDKK